jgi:hypothetical protein
MLSIDDEWDNFINNCSGNSEDNSCNNVKRANTFENSDIINTEIPKGSPIYISTKTKIAYLNFNVNLNDVFWKIKVNDYCLPLNGVIKKQMKFNSTTQEEVDIISEHLKTETCVDSLNITHINNPEGRIKFKDIRKISIGISKKDIISYRCKKKSAFYNCFVLILRLCENSIYKEFHVKVFNTGKLEIPGIQTEESFENILKLLIEILTPHFTEQITHLNHKNETVLINSNFNCGFYINREIFNDILKFKYKIQSIYDPCSYPGIQCKFYYDHTLSEQTGRPPVNYQLNDTTNTISIVSFMIFRTGSVLIVGKCDEPTLINIYHFIKNMLITEYTNICQHNQTNDKTAETKVKSKKIRKKMIVINI